MVVSSNSEDEDYTPKKPEEKVEIDNKNKTPLKISESPVEFSKTGSNLVSENACSQYLQTKRTYFNSINQIDTINL
jgi:hypothetical protein